LPLANALIPLLLVAVSAAMLLILLNVDKSRGLGVGGLACADLGIESKVARRINRGGKLGGSGAGAGKLERAAAVKYRQSPKSAILSVALSSGVYMRMLGGLICWGAGEALG